MASHEVTGCGAHVAHEVNEAGGRGRRATPRQVSRSCSDQQHLWAINTESNDAEHQHCRPNTRSRDGLINNRNGSQQEQQEADDRSPATSEEAIRRPTGEIGAGDGADWQNHVLEAGGPDPRFLHFGQVGQSPIQETVAAGVQKPQRDAQQPESTIRKREDDVFPE